MRQMALCNQPLSLSKQSGRCTKSRDRLYDAVQAALGPGWLFALFPRAYGRESTSVFVMHQATSDHNELKTGSDLESTVSPAGVHGCFPGAGGRSSRSAGSINSAGKSLHRRDGL